MNSIRNILVITYWSYKDALIQTYTLPYIRIMKSQLQSNQRVFLFTLEKDSHSSEERKLAIKKRLREEGIVWLPFGYEKFSLKAAIKWAVLIPYLIGLSIFRKVSHIHCWCTPAGAIGYLVSLFTSKKLIIDSYEPHAEAMVENGEWKKQSLAFRILFFFEKLQSKRAAHIISATSGMRQYMNKKYNTDNPSFYVKPACVNLKHFSLDKTKDQALLEELGLEEKIVAVYAGKFGGIYLDHQVFDFFKVAYDHWGDKFHVLILSSHIKEEIEYYCGHAGFPLENFTLKFVSHHQIPKYIGLGDFAFTPVKPVPTKRYCTPIKDGEYWALGLPVVITENISDDSDIIAENNIGAVLRKLDNESYKSAIHKIDALLQKTGSLSKKIRSIALQYRSFDIAREVYRKIYWKN